MPVLPPEDQPEYNNDDDNFDFSKLTESQKKKLLADQELDWKKKEKDLLNKLSLEENLKYHAYCHQIKDVNRRQLLWLHQQLVLETIIKDKQIVDMFKVI